MPEARNSIPRRASARPGTDPAIPVHPDEQLITRSVASAKLTRRHSSGVMPRQRAGRSAASRLRRSTINARRRQQSSVMGRQHPSVPYKEWLIFAPEVPLSGGPLGGQRTFDVESAYASSAAADRQTALRLPRGSRQRPSAVAPRTVSRFTGGRSNRPLVAAARPIRHRPLGESGSGGRLGPSHRSAPGRSRRASVRPASGPGTGTRIASAGRCPRDNPIGTSHLERGLRPFRPTDPPAGAGRQPPRSRHSHG